MAFDSDSVHNLFRMGGGWGNISGPGLFMAKAFVSGTIKAAIFGFTGATMCAVFYGTAALPFVVAASAGFALGTVGFYRDSVSRAFLALEKYPLLIRLHLHSNFPRYRFDSWELRQLRGEAFRGRWSWESMLVASYLSALPALERIKEQEEDAIVAREVEKLSWMAGTSEDVKS